MVHSDIDIRPATTADFDGLLVLHHALYIQHRDAVVPQEHLKLIAYRDYERVLAADLRSLLTKPDAFVLVATEGNELVGYVSGRVSAEHGRVLAKRGFVEDWYVVEGVRGQGVGARLLARLEAIFLAQQCTVVETVTWAANTGGLAAHQRLGFQPLMLTLRKALE